MTVQLQTSPFLPRQRNFPNDNAQVLCIEIDKTYIELASRINERTIGIYATGNQVITGETWYLSGQPNKQQTLRQVYNITSYAAFAHGIAFSSVSTFTVIRGIGFDGTNYFPIPFTNPTTSTGEVQIFVNPTQVVFVTGAGTPVLVSGIVILEWLSVF